MIIKYLGTAAAEGIPALFCNCRVCTEARKRGEKNIRTRSQALIDNKLLIDFNADTYMHTINSNVDLTKIDHCLITHSHDDHLYVNELSCRIPGFSNLGNKKPFKLYGTYGVVAKINGFINSKLLNPKGIVEVCEIKPYEPFVIDDYTVTALNAWHDVRSFPVIYMIENQEGKRLLYAHDTNFFFDEVWEYLKENKPKFDFVSLDCTDANTPELDYMGHMNLNDCKKVKDLLLKMNCADRDTVFCLNHFSHNGTDVLYEEFSAISEKSGFLVSYDNMEIEF